MEEVGWGVEGGRREVREEIVQIDIKGEGRRE